MPHPLLESFARLLTTDTQACSELFAPDAECRTLLGKHELCFRGREDIRRFLQHVPRQLMIRAGDVAVEGFGFRSELSFWSSDLPLAARRVSFQVEGGRFTRLDVQ